MLAPVTNKQKATKTWVLTFQLF